MLSFNGNKIITTSGGGAVACDDEDLISYMKKLSTQGRDDTMHYQHGDVAYNYRMSNILAGIGLGQLEQLRRFGKIWYTDENEQPIKRTINELNRTPKIIPIIALLRDIENRYDAKAPVQTPVNGKGIPTKNIRPINL